MLPSEIGIVNAWPGVENQLAEMRDRCMKQSLVAVGRYDSTRVRERLLADYDPNETYLLIASENSIVGFFCVRVKPDCHYLKHLYIDLPFQGAGLGSFVIAWIEETLKPTILRLNALRGSASNDFYLRNGFSITSSDEFDNYYEKSLLSSSASPRKRAEVALEVLGQDDLSFFVDLRLEVLRAANGLPESAELVEVRKATEAYFKRDSSWDQCKTILARSNGEVAGCGSIVFIEVLPTVGNPTGQKGYIMNMYTKPKFRRLGIGMRVLQKLFELAKARGIEMISLEATDQGKALYRKAGFTRMNDEMEIKLN